MNYLWLHIIGTCFSFGVGIYFAVRASGKDPYVVRLMQVVYGLVSIVMFYHGVIYLLATLSIILKTSDFLKPFVSLYLAAPAAIDLIRPRRRS